jgi:hypothetical protein
MDGIETDAIVSICDLFVGKFCYIQHA